jgi:hypothetical protein|tara:strand:+ start:35 stop:322 length:288 start_codon:yes stop_codon:yes gene_type:complete
LEFRKSTIKSFATVFDGEAETGDNVGDEDLTEMGRNNDANFSNRWGWFGVMYRLTNGDIIKLEQIARLELYVCLTWLCYETDLELTKKVQRNVRS